MTLPAEIEGMLPEIAELARVRRQPIARRSGGWFLNAWLLPDSTPVVTVMAEPVSPPEWRDSDVDASRRDEEVQRLCEQFGLTRAEARVARLLWKRYTNHEVAAALSISPHTARHHTGRILMKLGITRRSEVPSKITEAGIS